MQKYHYRINISAAGGSAVKLGQVVGQVGGAGSGGKKVYAEHLPCKEQSVVKQL